MASGLRGFFDQVVRSPLGGHFFAVLFRGEITRPFPVASRDQAIDAGFAKQVFGNPTCIIQQPKEQANLGVTENPQRVFRDPQNRVDRRSALLNRDLIWGLARAVKQRILSRRVL